jgi:hypothetical protein
MLAYLELYDSLSSLNHYLSSSGFKKVNLGLTVCSAFKSVAKNWHREVLKDNSLALGVFSFPTSCFEGSCYDSK